MISQHPYADVTERVAKDLETHEMIVLHDDGLYRHLRFKKPGTMNYYFDLVTWPGVLTITGDMGTYVFSRIEDMFNFFNDPYINAGYWGEKLRASKDYKRFSEERLEQRVREYLDEDPMVQEMTDDERTHLWERIEYEILGAGSSDLAHEALSDFVYMDTDPAIEFTDTWEWNFEDYTWQYLWSCAAIQWGIAKYRAAR
jgi:hypothetical protein